MRDSECPEGVAHASLVSAASVPSKDLALNGGLEGDTWISRRHWQSGNLGICRVDSYFKHSSNLRYATQRAYSQEGKADSKQILKKKDLCVM